MMEPPRRTRKRAAKKSELRERALSWRDRLGDSFTPAKIRAKWQEFQRKTHLTRTGLVAVVTVIPIWLVGRIIAGNALYIFAYGLLLLIALSYLLAPRRLRLIGERHGLFPRAQEGDRLDVEVRLQAERRLSTFILEERVPEKLGTPVKVPIPVLASKQEVSHRYSVRAARRGVYEIGPLVAIAGDPLGMTERETVVAEPFELLVHPRVEDVSSRPLTRQFEEPPIRPPVSKPWPSGMEFYGMREFAPGDDLRRIVWRASARTGKIMVREAEQGITDHITIMLDTYRGSHSKDGEYSESFETAVRAGASLGLKHLRQGYEIRLESNSGALARPMRGNLKQLPLLDAFSRAEMSRDPLSKMIMRLIADPRRDAHNILVTPNLGQTEAAQLRILLNKGVSVLVVALIWDEENAHTPGLAAALGCQVAAVHPGQELASALYSDIGAGNRL